MVELEEIIQQMDCQENQFGMDMVRVEAVVFQVVQMVQMVAFISDMNFDVLVLCCF